MSSQQAFRAYKMSGKVPFIGTIMALVGILIGGIISGLIVAGIAQLIYLIVVFPLVMAFTGVFLVAGLGTWAKIRNLWMCALLGLVAGAIVYSSYWVGEYLLFVESYYQEFQDEDLTRIVALNEVSAGLESDTDYPHIIGFVMWQIDNGVQLISQSNRPWEEDADFTLNSDQTALYYAVEAIGVLLFASFISYFTFRRKPFSESCGRWYKTATPEFLGFIPQHKDTKAFTKFMEAGRFEEASQLVSFDGGVTELVVYDFVDCGSDEVLFTEVIQAGNSTVDNDFIMTRNALNRFKQLLNI